MYFDYLDSIVALGVLLSFFLAFLIGSSKSFRSDVNIFFGLAIISLNLSLTSIWFEDVVPTNGILELINWQYLFPFAFLMYVLKALKSPLQSNTLIWLFLLPCLLLSGFQLVDFIFDVDVYSIISDNDDFIYNFLIELIAFSVIPYTLCLVGFSYYLILTSSTVHEQEKRWLQLTSLFILIFYFIWLICDLITTFTDFPIWQYLLAILGLFLSIIAYKGVQILNLNEQKRLVHDLIIESKKKTISNTEHPISNYSLNKKDSKIEKYR